MSGSDGAGPIVGIDLGTTNSLVAVCDAAGPRVLVEDGNADGGILPSVVRYSPGEAGRLRAVVGLDARDREIEFPRTTISSVKRLMGRSLADAAADVPFLGYGVVGGEHATARVAMPLPEGLATMLSPQEVSADILRALRARAEAALGESVTRAVVTVPAYFDDAQRQATRDAGRLAGLTVERIVNEPTAAALAYGLGLPKEHAEPRTVAVYDPGGGTFDISILRILPPAPDEDGPGAGVFQVLSTAGDTRLGGDDVDHMLVALFVHEIRAMLGMPESREGVDLSAFPPETRRALKAFAQNVKHKLSEEDSASVRVQINVDTAYERTVTRDEFEAMLTPWVERSIAACERATKDAKRELGDGGIDAVIMVGGSTRIPLVRRRVGEHFGVEPYTALDPDRVVALGAAVQGAILSGGVRDSLLLDVIPLSLGVETRGGAVAKLIVRNSTVPARATEMFSTSVDGQTNIKINVLQGEREMADDCRSLGGFDLRGIPPMPAGIPQLEVEFLVDESGVLRVSAHERRSGKRASVQIVPNHGLTRDEVERMEAESLEHARDDMTRHRVVDLIENSKLDLKWIGERLTRYGSKLEADNWAALVAARDELAGFVQRGEADWRSVEPNAFHAAKEALDRASVRLQEIGIAESLKGGG